MSRYRRARVRGAVYFFTVVTFDRRRERDVWQRRFWEHLIRDDEDLRRHVEYTHYNPVRHGLAPRPVDWPFSTFHRYVRRGVYEPTWGTVEPALLRNWDGARE